MELRFDVDAMTEMVTKRSYSKTARERELKKAKRKTRLPTNDYSSQPAAAEDRAPKPKRIKNAAVKTGEMVPEDVANAIADEEETTAENQPPAEHSTTPIRSPAPKTTRASKSDQTVGDQTIPDLAKKVAVALLIPEIVPLAASVPDPLETKPKSAPKRNTP